jgi:hypothetical protein
MIGSTNWRDGAISVLCTRSQIELNREAIEKIHKIHMVEAQINKDRFNKNRKTNQQGCPSLCSSHLLHRAGMNVNTIRSFQSRSHHRLIIYDGYIYQASCPDASRSQDLKDASFFSLIKLVFHMQS